LTVQLPKLMLLHAFTDFFLLHRVTYLKLKCSIKITKRKNASLKSMILTSYLRNHKLVSYTYK